MAYPNNTSVRKTKFEKPVEREVVGECLILQRGNWVNTKGWRWVFITDPEKKSDC